MSFFVTQGGDPCRLLKHRFRFMGKRRRHNILVAYPDDTPGKPARFPTIGQAIQAIRRTQRMEKNSHLPAFPWVIEPAWRRSEAAVQRAFDAEQRREDELLKALS